VTGPRVLQLLVYPGFVAAGLVALAIVARSSDERRRRRAVGGFLLYTLCASLGPGLVQRSAWPFPAWTIFQLGHPKQAREMRFLGVDAMGREHPIDGRAWEPFSLIELWAWAQHRLGELSPEDRQAAGRHLLELADTARAAALAGRPPGRFARHLGPLAAPLHIMPRRHWRRAGDVPAAPLTAIRFYWYLWNVEERRLAPDRVTRELVFEYARP
jgi:hypothetical protein